MPPLDRIWDGGQKHKVLPGLVKLESLFKLMPWEGMERRADGACLSHRAVYI